MKEGVGVYKYYFGSIYSGEWVNDRQRKGVVTDKNGVSYQGEWDSRGVDTGKGVKTWPNGDRYEGEFDKDRKKAGKGVFVWSNGIRYEGEFENDKKNGFGKITTPKNSYYSFQASDKGKWVGDNFIEQGLFKDDELVRSCVSIEDCRQKEKKEEQEASVLLRKLKNSSARFYTNDNGSLVWERKSKLVWKRCAEGQTWNGGECSGDPRYYKDPGEAYRAEGGEWRVPSINELLSLVKCPGGRQPLFDEIGSYEFKKHARKDICGVKSDGEYRIDRTAFPGGDSFWSASRKMLDDYGATLYAWFINYKAGNSDYQNDCQVGLEFGVSEMGVRLVSREKLIDSKAVLQFSMTTDEYQSKYLAKKRAEEDLAEKARAQEERRRELAKSSAWKKLVSSGAQSMYLQAGKAQRSGGSVNIDGFDFYANKIYEAIIERYPNSEYATKASDQLSAMSRQDQFESNRRNEQYESSKQCRKRKWDCSMGCPSGNAHFSCYQRCQSICSE